MATENFTTKPSARCAKTRSARCVISPRLWAHVSLAPRFRGREREKVGGSRPAPWWAPAAPGGRQRQKTGPWWFTCCERTRGVSTQNAL
ncbi:hypothetical protein LX36DRAFT_346366 [Colletotrichum falcatum]|nr:hypothetical protein LX36DRAFT_346366 [Colletotrichum falcatum]